MTIICLLSRQTWRNKYLEGKNIYACTYMFRGSFYFLDLLFVFLDFFFSFHTRNFFRSFWHQQIYDSLLGGGGGGGVLLRLVLCYRPQKECNNDTVYVCIRIRVFLESRMIFVFVFGHFLESWIIFVFVFGNFWKAE